MNIDGMEGTDFALILTAIGTLVGSVGAVIIGIINAFKIKEVHKTVNSRMDELLRTTRLEEQGKTATAVEIGRAEGVMQGKAEGK